jgi:hypothetical protein
MNDPAVPMGAGPQALCDAVARDMRGQGHTPEGFAVRVDGPHGWAVGVRSSARHVGTVHLSAHTGSAWMARDALPRRLGAWPMAEPRSTGPVWAALARVLGARPNGAGVPVFEGQAHGRVAAWMAQGGTPGAYALPSGEYVARPETRKR